MIRKTFTSFVFTFLLLTFGTCVASAQIISTIAGGSIGNDSLATKAELIGPVGIAVDKAGNTYIVDESSYRVRKVDTSGIITTIAGTGSYGYSGDGGPALAANLGVLYGVAIDKWGNVYVVDNSNNCIRKIDTLGIITTIAGTGAVGFSGDGGLATAADLNNPIDILVDTSGNVIFTDWGNNVVRKINTSGIITTIVGDGLIGTTGNGGAAIASQLGRPFRIAMDRLGNLYVAEVVFECICKVDTAGIITIVGGTGAYALGPDGDGDLATLATMTSPCGLSVDTSNNLYFSDIGNFRIRKINLTTGVMSAFAASGTAGYGGDGGIATAAKISSPEGLAVDNAGNVLICDPDNNRIRKVTTTDTISTFAGQSGLFEEGYPAIASELSDPINLATDAAGNVYVADYYNQRVRMINAATGVMTTVAGSGTSGYGFSFSGDGGPATEASLSYPSAVAVDAAGNIYINDLDNQRIRKVSTSGIISTVAGNGTAGFSGDGGTATLAKLNDPTDIAIDAAGNLYIADQGNQRIRKVDVSGTITTIAGTGSAGYSGDSGLATLAKLDYPTYVTVDKFGNIFITDNGNNCIRKIDTAGIISTITSSGAAGFSGDGGLAIDAQINYPAGIKADTAGNVLFSDVYNQRVRMITNYGVIKTIAGNGAAGFSGDGGAATAAKLNNPSGIAVDKNGNVFIGDAGNNRIRKVNVGYILGVPPAPPVLSTIHIYPNPAHDKLFIASASAPSGDAQVTLINPTGQVIYTTPLLLNKQTIDLSGLATGIYLLELSNHSDEKQVIKVIKE